MSLKDLLDNVGHTSTNIIGVLEGEERKGEKKKKQLFDEIMAENFPNLGKKHIQAQEKQTVTKKMNPKRFTPRYVIIKMAKVNGKILREAKEKQLITYKRNAIRLSADFLAETLQAITG